MRGIAGYVFQQRADPILVRRGMDRRGCMVVFHRGIQREINRFLISPIRGNRGICEETGTSGERR
jgi:hypothetical protein